MQKLSKPSEYASDNSDLSRLRIFTETRMDASVQSGVIAAMDDIQAVPTRRQTRRRSSPTVSGRPSIAPRGGLDILGPADWDILAIGGTRTAPIRQRLTARGAPPVLVRRRPDAPSISAAAPNECASLALNARPMLEVCLEVSVIGGLW